MALQAWFPFNGNLENYGITGIYALSGPQSYGEGLIGASSLLLNGTKYTYTSNVYDKTGEVSICFWARTNTDDTSEICSVQVGDEYLTVSLPSGTDNKWTFVTLVRSVSYSKLYTNGTLINHTEYEVVRDSSVYSFTGYFRIGNSSNSSIYLNDFRIYDNCLSIKEISDIMKSMVIHYTLSDSECGILPQYNSIEYDVSGFMNNATRHNITYSENTPRYLKSSILNNSWFSSDTYVNFVKDKATVSTWIYMEDWTLDQDIMYIMDAGGFAVYYSSAEQKVKFYVNSNAVSYTEPLSTGWHMLAGVYDGTNLKLYIDGRLSASSTISESSSINYEKDTVLTIGADQYKHNLFTGQLSEFRLYVSALSDKDVLELYNSITSISNNGTMLCAEFQDSTEEYSKVTKTGFVITNNFEESNSEVKIYSNGTISANRFIEH